MARTEEDGPPWPSPAHRTSSRNDLTAPATQIVRDREDYLGQNQRDIGRRLTEDQVELFVSGDPAPALQQQLDRVAPEYIAVHDVGTPASLRLLGALAGAAGARVQRLSIRRQGLGVALAVIQFVEIPVAGGAPLRIYSTDVNADTQARTALSLVLLGRAQLGVLMVGELPPHAMTAALQPLRTAIQRGPWANRELLLLPLGSSTTLAAQGAQLTGHSGVVVRVTPQAARPNDAWSFISGTWNRLKGSAPGAAPLETDISHAMPRPQVPTPEAPTQPMELSASPAYPPMAMPTNPRWADYAQRCAAIKGVVSCCVFDVATQRPLAHAGGMPPADRLASQGGALLDALSHAARSLGLGNGAPEAALSVGQQHLLLKPVPGHPGTVLHLVLQASPSNLTLARMQLERVAVPS
jgi:hypothetical protein